MRFVRPGDVLVVWKLDRLGRSLKNLLEMVTALKERGVYASVCRTMFSLRRNHGISTAMKHSEQTASASVVTR
ncbi:MAG: recombinase family protein [Chloroflexi bacterium]|nr:recombinase family protein [Chloroflexota bacterium]